MQRVRVQDAQARQQGLPCILERTQVQVGMYSMMDLPLKKFPLQ